MFSLERLPHPKGKTQKAQRHKTAILITGAPHLPPGETADDTDDSDSSSHGRSRIEGEWSRGETPFAGFRTSCAFCAFCGHFPSLRTTRSTTESQPHKRIESLGLHGGNSPTRTKP